MSATPGRPTVTVYTRQGCGLCRRAEAVVAATAAGQADVELVDIDTDAELVARYTVRVPVVAVDGRELFEYHVDPAALRAALRAATTATTTIGQVPAARARGADTR